MKKILEILWIERKISKVGTPYFKTMALLETGEECAGFGEGFKVGDEVEYWFDEQWQQTKMKHGGMHENQGRPSRPSV